MQRRRYIYWLPNIITFSRLLSVPVLAWMAYHGLNTAFAALLVLALLSDIADGVIARRLGIHSATGAILDSTADSLLMAVIVYGIWAMHRGIFTEYGTWIIPVVVLWVLGHIAALIRFRRLASFHSYLIRAASGSVGLFASVLFIFGFVPALLYLATVICTLAVLEHFLLLLLVPDWQPDVRGGLLEVLQQRQKARREKAETGPD